MLLPEIAVHPLALAFIHAKGAAVDKQALLRTPRRGVEMHITRSFTAKI